MTSQEVDVMDAGGKLDALVAHYVLGWKIHEWADLPNTERTAYCHLCGTTRSRSIKYDFPDLCLPGNVRKYSTDIAAAWEVVEKLSPNSWAGFGNWANMDDGNNWWAGFELDNDVIEHKSHAPTMPLAICRAALKAVLSK